MIYEMEKENQSPPTSSNQTKTKPTNDNFQKEIIIQTTTGSDNSQRHETSGKLGPADKDRSPRRNYRITRRRQPRIPKLKATRRGDDEDSAKWHFSNTFNRLDQPKPDEFSFQESQKDQWNQNRHAVTSITAHQYSKKQKYLQFEQTGTYVY